MDDDSYTEKQDLADAEQSISYMAGQFNEPNFGQVIADAESKEIFEKLEPIFTSAVFAGLLLEKGLQSNCCRLEALIHLAFGASNGHVKVDKQLVKSLFSFLRGTSYGYSEDPSEDVMVGVIHDDKGSYKILEGIWESNTFYLQHFVEIVLKSPENVLFSQLKDSINSILKISNEIIERSCLERNCVGNTNPIKEIPNDMLEDISSLVNRIKFTKDDFNKLGINYDSIQVFVFPYEERHELLNTNFGASLLEQKPIVEYEDDFYVLLPTAIGLAVKNLIISISINNKILDTLNSSFQLTYVNYFHNKVRLLGKIDKTRFTPFKSNDEKILGGQALVGIDKGRYIHFILTFDDFDNYQDSFFNSISPNGDVTGGNVEKQIEKTHNYASRQPNFIEGLTIIIGCGWGRPVIQEMPGKTFKNWSVEFISAPDMTTFSLISSMNPFTFWRLIEAKRKIAKTGAIIQNINGLLNLYGWAKSNNFHLVPHSDLPDDLLPENVSSFFMMIQQNSLLDIRADILQSIDKHSIVSPYDELVTVMRITRDSFYEEDKNKPIYASVEDLEDKELLGLIYGQKREWWCKPVLASNSNKDIIYRIWEGLCSWIYRLDPIIEPLISELVHSKLLWTWELVDKDIPVFIDNTLDYEQLIEITSTEVEILDGCIIVESKFGKDFLLGFHQEKNFAEKAMIASLVRGVLSLRFEGEALEENITNVLSRVFADLYGKSVHVLKAQNYLDRVKKSLTKPIFVDKFDDANSRVGLGWLCREPGDSSLIEGVGNCTEYLRNLTNLMWLEIKSMLSQFNKEKTIMMLLNNHESLDSDSEHWTRTFKASLGLHKDKKNVYNVVTEQLGNRNAGLLGTRIIIEMALCECEQSDGQVPSPLDVTKLITYATSLFQYGNSSDSIRFEMTSPKIQISPMGDVMFDHSFYDLVVVPYGQATQEKMLDYSAKEYSSLFNEPAVGLITSKVIEAKFENAWESEFGFSIDNGRTVMDFIEDLGFAEGMAVFKISHDDFLIKVAENNLDLEVIESFLAVFTSYERASWLSVPSGFKENDIRPWRFKRRLSVISKPIIKIGENLILAPSLIRKGFVYILRNSFEASFGDDLFRSKQMKKWIGHKRNTVGHEFNKEAALKFIENGWLAESDVLVSKILNKKMDKNYGDVDVVAWDKTSGIICLVECKDLEFAKNPSEIARQVYEFRGVNRPDGKPDRLKKHLNRVSVLNENKDVLRKFLKINEDVPIKIRTIILFSQLVPMEYVKSEEFKNVEMMSFDSITRA